MGASNFAGQFAKNPDWFDGDGRQTRDNKTNNQLDLYSLMKELAYQNAKRQKEAIDGAAGTATAEHAFHLMDGFTKSIQKIVYVPGAALTADNTNFATLIVRARKSDGTLASIVGQVTTQITGSGNWVQHVPVTIPLFDGTNILPIDSAALDIFGVVGPLAPLAPYILTFEITKTAAGVAVPPGVLEVFWK